MSGGPTLAAFNQQMDDMAASLNMNSEEEVRAWWIFRILQSPFPLKERLTLFWHNHFATSNAKVRNLSYMLGQNQLMRRNALGSFRTMLEEMSKDPAMMIWLDTALSKKGQANENYARELMELFSLGIGHYTEQDVREGARAFTGWEIVNGKFHLNSYEHDSGEKQFLGKSGNWGGEDIVRICLEQDAAAYFITGKLFRFFISDTVPPTRDLLEPLARRFRESDYDFGAWSRRCSARTCSSRRRPIARRSSRRSISPSASCMRSRGTSVRSRWRWRSRVWGSVCFRPLR